VKLVAVLSSMIGLCAAPVTLAEDLDLDDIELPKGFVIEKYADVPNARSIALGLNNVVYVSTRQAKTIYAVVPRGDANPQVIEIIKSLDTPNGIAYYNGDLFVAETERIYRLRNVEQNLNSVTALEPLNVRLPAERHNGWRYIGIGPDFKLYVSIGAPCNVCDRGARGFAQIWRMNLDGSGVQTYAQGVRNSVGFTWHPDTRELWFTDNGRDMLGDDEPADELNVAPRAGMHFGFPFCHGGDIPDPEFGAGTRCSDFVPPVLKLGPHVAALGLEFYTGRMFPEEYRGRLFIAEHGSWNRSKKFGYRIMMVELVDSMPVSYEVFAEGWMHKDKVYGRPVDLQVIGDGSLLVSDDHAGKLYRIRYEED